MRQQVAKYTAFYALVAAVFFPLGWWASRRVSERIDKFDPRIERGKHGW